DRRDQHEHEDDPDDPHGSTLRSRRRDVADGSRDPGRAGEASLAERLSLRATGVVAVGALGLDAAVRRLDHDLRVAELAARGGRGPDGLGLALEPVLLAGAL